MQLELKSNFYPHFNLRFGLWIRMCPWMEKNMQNSNTILDTL